MNKKTIFLHIDWLIVLPVFVLIIFSLTTLFSIGGDFFRNQLIFAILGIVVFLIFSQLNYRIFQVYAMPIYVVSLVLLFLLLIVGFESRGAVRWVSIFGVALQFSEILKPFLIFAFAVFLTSQESISFRKFLLALGFLLPVAFFIYRQPDLGNAIIYLLTALVMLLVYGFPWWWFGVGIAGFVGSIPIAWRFLHQYQRERVLTFFHLTNDPQGTSYNAIQSIIAVGSGQFFGKGLGQGTQSALKFLPERQTDFLFATLAEMLGFVGAGIVIVAFVILLYRLFVLMQSAEEASGKLYIAGAFALVAVQFFINIAMNIGMLPIVGVTLPFISYGGSSFLANSILLGLVCAMSQKPRSKQVLEIR